MAKKSTQSEKNSESNSRQNDGFLVCGLGSLGQHCVANLKTFGVPVHAVTQQAPDQWEVPHLADFIDHLEIGDCRRTEVLEKAGIKRCRAVLLVTQDERVNLEAALTARVLNPQVRLVMRSDKQNLNDLMAQQLQNFVAFEPTQLAAPAFALEAFGGELLGYFPIEEHRFQVTKQRIEADHPWCNRRQIYELDSSHRRVLRHLSHQFIGTPEHLVEDHLSPSTQFYNWLPDTSLQVGDEVVTITSDSQRHDPSRQAAKAAKSRRRSWLASGWHALDKLRHGPGLRAAFINLWQASYGQQIRRVAIICGLTVALLCLVGTVLLKINATENLTLFQAFQFTFIMLFGGYGDVLDHLENLKNPALIQVFGILITIAGTAFIGVLYALLTEKLLTLRFEFMERRPPVPEKDHVVVIWLGRVGRQVLQLLQELGQPVVGLAPTALDADVLPQIPLLTGDITTALGKANLATAKSVVAVSDDEIQNLEMGLLAHRANPQCRAIIRTYDQQFTDRVAKIFPFAQVLCASAISAEAFAGAAFGEHVIGLFRLYQQTVLVTQYATEPGDTLEGRLLSEIAYGYGVLPIWHRRPPQSGQVMPSEDIRLRSGDRLVVMATIRGLRRIEQRQIAPQTWKICVEKALTADALFEGASEIARISGYNLGTAREFMAHLPGILPQSLYHHQAMRLVRLLTRAQVQARVLEPTDTVRL